MKNTFLFTLLFFFFTTYATDENQQKKHIYYGREAEKIITNASIVRLNNYQTPTYIEFKKEHELPLHLLEKLFKNEIKINKDLSFTLIKKEIDNIGISHLKYQQYYKSIPIEGAIVNVHVSNGKIKSINGDYFKQISSPQNVLLTESQALQMALNKVDASLYMWQSPKNEKFIKLSNKDNRATYYPSGELVLASPYLLSPDKISLCYRFDIYAETPLYRAWVYVDASNGKIISERNRIHHTNSNGVALTAYSGEQSIITDSLSPNNFRLIESSRGNGIQTFNMQQGTSYGSSIDFTDNDNYWNNINANLDQYATDAHWGAEMTYDYFLQEHGRNSIDNAGFQLNSYIHYDVNYFNAFWNGAQMTYGDGNGSPLVSMDIVGHEITHGLTEFTAGLIYSYESGALNESFSDIFGASIEWFAKPSTANWLLSDEIGTTFRNMADPNALGDPDTYLGVNWHTSSSDNGGVHTNSGVQNYWYYLLVNGGSGTNDNGDNYNVSGIGLSSASAIAFRSLTIYLTSTSQYEDARFYAIQAAIDLFGACSFEVEQTTRAWHAVGVGPAWVPTVFSDFESTALNNCSPPFLVNFDNLSVNGQSFIWDFGDGNSSTQVSPSHIYTTFGNFDIQLYVDGGSCGNDTTIKFNYVSIDTSHECNINIGTGPQTACTGVLYDDGGISDNYSDNISLQTTIAPTGASSVLLNFTDFAIEPGSSNNCDYDYIEIYDGSNTSSALIGRYCNDTGSPGLISSSGGEITILLYSDAYVTYSGFRAEWMCIMPNSPPIARFTVDHESTCSGDVVFTDESFNNASNWLWDFGDGSTSNSQHPTHTYYQNGTYTVTLTVGNTNGTDVITKTDYITVNKPASPSVTNASICGSGNATLTATSSGGTIHWYNDSISINSIHTGNNYTTPTLTSTTHYYVEEVFDPSPIHGGPSDNTIGSGGNFNGDQHLIFDCYTPTILKSVLVYAQGDGNRTIQLRDYTGAVIEEITTFIPHGQSRVVLNFSIPVENNLQLGTPPGAQDLFRNSTGASYPYNIGGFLDIKRSSASGTDAYNYYYFFYDWEVDVPTCRSLRAESTVNVGSVLSFNIIGQDSICYGDTATLSSSTSLSSYQWSPSGDTSSSISIFPTSTSQYILYGTNNCGSAYDTLTVVVHPLPTISASNDTFSCINQDITLTANHTGNVNWMPGNYTTSSITVSPSSNTTYIATASNSCGNVYDSVFLEVLTKPSAAFIAVNNSLTVNFNNNSINATAWFWDFGDGQTSTDENPTHTYLEAGTYTTMLIAMNICGNDTIIQNTIITTPEGIQENNKGVKIYPNPLNSVLIVDFTVFTGSETMLLYNYSGQQIKKVFLEKKTKVDVSNLPKGMYMYEILRNNEILQREKIIKY